MRCLTSRIYMSFGSLSFSLHFLLIMHQATLTATTFFFLEKKQPLLDPNVYRGMFTRPKLSYNVVDIVH
jgi:hypothetical protein